MCGILGIYGYADVSRELVIGLNALQHRGQDSAGIVTFKNHFQIKKGLGLVSGIFSEETLKWLRANSGIGHVRYATHGTIHINQAQPIYMNFPLGIAMVHNGNVINFRDLSKFLEKEHHMLIETTNDVELILYALAAQLESKLYHKLTPGDVFDCVSDTQEIVQGAFSAIALIANNGMLAFTDPHGIRPLVMGIKSRNNEKTYAFSSETTCFDTLGFEFADELGAGEAIFIDSRRHVHKKTLMKKKPSFCIFEYIYFAREDSVIQNNLVANERIKMGRLLAQSFRKRGLEPDVVIDVPASAYFFASALAQELGVQYKRGLTKNKYMGRSFLMPTQKERDQAVKQKLNPIAPFIKDKKIAVVDDSIVRGTTSKHIVELLRDKGAREVYFISAAPPIKFPCVYGIDMSIKTELVAANHSLKDIEQCLKADAVIYQSVDDLKSLYRDRNFCYACFDGNYPVSLSSKLQREIEFERLRSKRCRKK